MKKELIRLFLVSILMVPVGSAQEKKWNVELNYSVVPADGFGGKDNVIDFGVKRRLLEYNVVNFGLSTNVGIFNDSGTLREARSGFVFFGPEKTTNFIIQPRIFSEFQLPFSQRLRPSFAIGYTNIITRVDVEDAFWGFNVNFNLGYDIFDEWIMQMGNDYLSLAALNGNEGFNNIRLGLGYRF